MGVFGFSRLNWNVDILDLLPRGMEGVEGMRVLRDGFQKAGRLVVTLEAEDAEKLERAADTLAERLAKVPGLCKRVDARPGLESQGEELAEMAAWAWWNAPPEAVRAFVESLAGDGAGRVAERTLEEAATSQDPQVLAAAAYDPLGFTGALRRSAGSMLEGLSTDGYSSADGTFRIVFAEPAEPLADYRAAAAWLERVRNEGVAAWRAGRPEESAGVAVAFTGEPAFNAEIGTGMERDMSQSVGGITVIVAGLFWLLHRTLTPLLLLLLAIFCTNLLTLGAAGIVYGGLNMMSMGFAAILTGMVEDFGVVALHEARAMPGQSWKAVCRRVFPGVLWSAVTVACVFGSLGLSSLPGVAQLGVLSALGILIGAAVMLFGFLPAALRLKAVVRTLPPPAGEPGKWRRRLPGICAGVVAAACGVVLLAKGFPEIRRDANMLRPVESEAFAAMERLQEKMQPPDTTGEWLPLTVSGASEEEVARSLNAAAAVLRNAKDAEEIAAWYLPAELFPAKERHAANAGTLAALTKPEERVRLESAVIEAGYEPEGFALGRAILDCWERWIAEPETRHWPGPALLEGAFGQVMQHEPRVAAAGFVHLRQGEKPSASPVVDALEEIPGVRPAGWTYLGEKLQPLLRREFYRVCLPAALVLAALLFFVFRGARERVLAAGALAFSALILLGYMTASGIPWNFINLAAIPLSLGLGLDFTIHMIYALRRHDAEGGDGTRGAGRALAYCGLSTGLGFGSLALSGNAGLVSLGKCSMVGVLAALFTAAFLLPWAWRVWPRQPGR